MQYRISIVNPNPIAREGLRRIIEDEGVDVLDALSSVDDVESAEERPDMVLLDLVTPAEQISSVRFLASQYEDMKVVVLAEKFDYATMATCFGDGAQGYIVKNTSCSTLIALLRLAAAGQKIIPSDLADLLPRQGFMLNEPAQEAEASIADSNLSQREHEVLCCLMAGYPNKLIARKLDVSEATIKVHVKAILRKLNVMNRTQAAIWATSRGIGSDMRAVA